MCFLRNTELYYNFSITHTHTHIDRDGHIVQKQRMTSVTYADKRMTYADLDRIDGLLSALNKNKVTECKINTT